MSLREHDEKFQVETWREYLSGMVVYLGAVVLINIVFWLAGLRGQWTLGVVIALSILAPLILRRLRKSSQKGKKDYVDKYEQVQS